MSKTMSDLTEVTSGLGTAATVWVSDGSLTPIDNKMTVDNFFADRPLNKNYIINGNMNMVQRGTAAVTATGAYGPADRWINGTNGNTFSMSYETFTNTDTLFTTYGATNYIECAVTSVADAANFNSISQRIEDVTLLSDKTVTVSFWAKADSGTPLIGCEIFQTFGTGGSPSSSVSGTGQSITLSTTWTKYSLTFAIPSISGKTLGTTANTSYSQLRIWLDAGSDFNTRSGSIGQASKTVSIAQVMLNEGSVAMPFNYYGGSKIADEEACYRYYEKIGGGLAQRVYASGFASAATVGRTFLSFKNKRALPTASVSAVDDFLIAYGTSTEATTNMVIGLLALNTARVIATVGAVLTPTEGVMLLGDATTDHFIDLSAEL